MSYLDGVKKLTEIESEYDVMSIAFKGVPVWPFLRINLLQILGHTNNESAHKVSSSKIIIILKSLFSYSPLYLFKRNPIWIFNGQERRKKIGDKWIHRVSGFFASSGIKFLDIEKPTKANRHLKKSKIEETDIISESWFILFSHIIEQILKYYNLKIDNEDILKKILNQNNIEFDYKYFIRYLWSQKIITDLILRLSSQPSVVFMECPYPIMGYIWSFKNHGIKVIELQHGVLNQYHYAYTLRYFSIFNPDEIWVYGDREKEFFHTYNPFYTKNVQEIGLYILDRAKAYFIDDIFINFRKKYVKIVVFSGQTAVEGASQEFLKDIAILNPDFLFIYIPRQENEIIDCNLINVIAKPNVNIYEYLKWCDLHVTISSTTCLEALYYNRKTIFFDFQGLASKYYGEYLRYENGVQYITNAHDFRKAVNELDSQKNFKRRLPFAEFNGLNAIEKLHISYKF